MIDSTLRHARLGTLAAAAALSLALGVVVSPRYGAGVMVTAIWAVAGFWLLEALTRRTLVPAGTPRPLGAIAALAAAKVVLYGIAVWALLARVFPVTSHLIGFSLLLGALLVASAVGRRARAGAPARRAPGEEGTREGDGRS